MRRQKWTVRRRELELEAATNHLLPRLDAIGRGIGYALRTTQYGLAVAIPGLIAERISSHVEFIADAQRKTIGA